jgi:hypothetical protein
MRARLFACLFVLAAAGAAPGGAAASSGAAATKVRAVYRTVLEAEYFGPASTVCSRLTARAVKSYTAGGAGTCAKAFEQQQHVLRHKTKFVENSGYTPAGWRREVNSVMAHLKVSVHGRRATAIGGQSGIPGQTKLLEVKGRWLFDSYPPSVQP